MRFSTPRFSIVPRYNAITRSPPQPTMLHIRRYGVLCCKHLLPCLSFDIFMDIARSLTLRPVHRILFAKRQRMLNILVFMYNGMSLSQYLSMIQQSERFMFFAPI